ncbi:MAG TPA: Lrp/AsnC family transcriptional regulator [Propionicimonas sp.]|jgi:Lrp/AsnC family transcriptional regulator for asnA, asnC and gidA|uniref:Lrp/AsnC family transcriptional regulator n=1 Tax=Propionicimonas sp. TaxID=1955623 RepID=UPI002F3F4B44
MAQQRGGPPADQTPAANGRPALTDAVGKRIIELLQRDGRRPFVSIAAEVGLSEGAVRQRVQRLIDTGVMQIVAVTDPLVVGFTRQAMIGIKTQGDVGPVADQLCEIPQIDYVVTTAGSFDLLVEVVCEGDAELLDVLMTQIRTIPEVTHTETFVYLKLNKQHYDWGTR